LESEIEINSLAIKAQTMAIESTKAVGSTRLWRVQFGVPPNCIGAQTACTSWMDNGNVRWQQVSGATPETTRETRVPPHFSPHFRD
jgi:hypothetical protein